MTKIFSTRMDICSPVVPAKARTHGAASSYLAPFFRALMPSGERMCGGKVGPGLRRDDNWGEARGKHHG